MPELQPEVFYIETYQGHRFAVVNSTMTTVNERRSGLLAATVRARVRAAEEPETSRPARKRPLPRDI